MASALKVCISSGVYQVAFLSEEHLLNSRTQTLASKQTFRSPWQTGSDIVLRGLLVGKGKLGGDTHPSLLASEGMSDSTEDTSLTRDAMNEDALRIDTGSQKLGVLWAIPVMLGVATGTPGRPRSAGRSCCWCALATEHKVTLDLSGEYSLESRVEAEGGGMCGSCSGSTVICGCCWFWGDELLLLLLPLVQLFRMGVGSSSLP